MRSLYIMRPPCLICPFKLLWDRNKKTPTREIGVFLTWISESGCFVVRMLDEID